VQIDSNGLEILDRMECFRLLGKATLGRVAVTADALPCILPLTFKVSGNRILFRTSPGTKLEAATRNAVVAFEVDELDAAAHTGWSVLVTGVASEVTDPNELEAAQRLQLPRWAPSPGDRIVAVTTELVTGRRIVSPAP
jgi:nitroimidazol reductase NimA-like FMN-containing flavoprotein (pyridoxamine 5'-phosphate oxidase superfamily)